MNCKRMLFLTSLILGLTVLWSTGVPAQMVADEAALVGGQVMVGCCQGQHLVNCHDFSTQCCSNMNFNACINLGLGAQRCWRYDNTACVGADICYSVRSETCLNQGETPPANP